MDSVPYNTFPSSLIWICKLQDLYFFNLPWAWWYHFIWWTDVAVNINHFGIDPTLITTCTVRWVHPPCSQTRKCCILHFSSAEYQEQEGVGPTHKPGVTWLSNSMLILHKITLRCHVSPEKEESCSPWDASNQETACWLQCFEPSIHLEDSYASVTNWIWNPPHRLLGSIFVLSWKMLFGRFWNLWWVRLSWRRYVTEDLCFVPDLTLSAGWAATVDALVITFCLILGPELIELRTMHWDIWNCELRKLLLPFKFFCSESLEQELSLTDKVTNTFWLKCTSSENYSRIILVHEVLWETISSLFLMAKTQRENRK